MNETKRRAGQAGFVLCSALLFAQTGCILPGMRGGPPGLPGLPGPPRVERPNPSRVSVIATAGKYLVRNDSSQLILDET